MKFFLALDFTAIEDKWQQRWYSGKAFEPAPDERKPKFFFTVPYPYVSGTLHVGHGRTYTYGDVIARFKRMQGFNVLWPMAFHITGTPVLAVSAKIAAGDGEALKLYRDYVSTYEKNAAEVEEIVKSFADPRKVVEYFSSKIIEDFKSIGYSLDLSRQFTTGDREYNKFIEWQFHKYKKKGYLKQAAYPLLYCKSCANAAGEDDIQDGDTNPVDLQVFTAFKFRVEGEDAFVVSSTLRPETVFGITNMFVNPSVEYVKAVVDGEQWYVSQPAAEKLALQNHSVKVLEKISGEKLVGKTLVSPIGARVPVLPAFFVDADNATGFVHSVPAHAPYDWIALQDLKKDEKTLCKYGIADAVKALKPIPLISTPGYGEFPAAEVCERMKIANARETPKLDKATAELYKKEFYEGTLGKNCGEFAGKKVEEAKDEVIAWLKEKGVATDFYETTRPAKCRCGGQVVAAVLPSQWFIDFNAPGWKERARECLERMFVFPPNYKKQFEDIFAWLDKRPCARRRGLGTQLPFANEWIIESLSDSTIYMAFYTVIKQIKRFGVKPEQLREEFFDYVFLGAGTAEAVAKTCGVNPMVLKSVRKEFEYWYPNDLRHTAVAHVTNHLSFFIFAHTAIFSPKHWPRALSLNEMLVREGAKMSKSKGNVIILSSVKERYGADLFRLYVSAAAEFGSVLDFRDKDVEATRRSFVKWAELVLQLIELSKKAPARQGDSIAVKWMLSKFETAVMNSTQALEAFSLRAYVQSAFYNLLNAWDYFSRRATEEEKAFVAKEIVGRWILLMCPVVPHACEEFWQMLGGNGFASLAAWPQAREERVAPEIEEAEDYVASVFADLRKVRELVKVRASEAVVIVASKAKVEAMRAALQKAARPEEIVLGDEALKQYAAKNFFELREKRELDEYSAVSQALAFLSRESGLRVRVEREEESRQEKRGRAMPFKPAIVLS